MTVVSFGEAARGRVTGWAVACSGHGAMPVLAPTRQSARAMAALHVQHEHEGAGTIEERRFKPRKNRPPAQPERRSSPAFAAFEHELIADERPPGIDDA